MLLATIAITAALALSAQTARAEYVCNLNPYGDNFLSLRTGPSSRYPEIMRMGANTVVIPLRASGDWYNVRLLNGTVGWAYDQYICPGFPR